MLDWVRGWERCWSALTLCVPFALAPPTGAGTAPHAAGGIARGFRATGFFHTAVVGHRMWLVDPSGRPFYSSGADHVSSSPDTDRQTGRCPYCDAVAVGYPSIDAWSDAQIARLRRWGFNTLGSFSEGTPRLRRQMPYTELLSLANGSDWFAPSFEAHAYADAAPLSANRDDPNLIGYFTDSELHWGPDWRSQAPVLDDYLKLPPGSPGRAVADAHVGDPSGFLLALAQRYFSVTTAAVHAADPNHLILGVKAVAQLIEPELLEAARPYVDVWSMDDYAILPGVATAISSGWPAYLPDEPGFTSIEAVVRRPILIGEYGFRAADSGLPNTWPPLFPTFPTQAERTASYQAYVAGLYRNPAVVGDHWFEYVDEPVHGRFDGEDSNWGVLSNADVPYATLVAAMTKVHAASPARWLRPPWACTSWAATAHGRPTCRSR